MTLGILVVDDNEPYRVGVRAIVEAGPPIEVRGEVQTVRWLEAATKEEGLNKVMSQQPDIVLADLRLPDRIGITDPKIGLEFTREVLREWPRTKVIVLTVCREDDLVNEALRAGARSYLVKDADDHASDLLRTLQAVANDDLVLGKPASEVLSKILSRGTTTAPYPFNKLDRERDKRYWAIVDLIGEGLEYKDIATRLKTPAATVNNQISEIVRRLDLPSRNLLYFWAGRVLGG